MTGFLLKLSYIRQLSSGKWRVYSRNGRNLGTYDSHSAAKKRLAQVEMFKAMKENDSCKDRLSGGRADKKDPEDFDSDQLARGTVHEMEHTDDPRLAKEIATDHLAEITDYYDKIEAIEKRQKTAKKEEVISYSGMMRQLRKDSERLKKFMVSFKGAFDEAYIEDLENPAAIALTAALKEINYKKDESDILMASNSDERIYKLATSILELGDPKTAGKTIADIVRFLLKRISNENRAKALINLRNKIWKLNAYEISSKKNPATASLGQSITFIKTILIGHDPIYVRSVINNIVRNLY